MKTYKEYKEVQRCLKIIESKLEWGSSKLWHSDVFIELSERIHKETQVLLSPTTLKRVWGKVNYKNAPSISTLNALAQFSGFLNWRDFKNNAIGLKLNRIKKTIGFNGRVIMFSAVIVASLFFILFAMSNNNSTITPSYASVTFKSRSIAKGLPNSVVFDFNLKGVKSNNILIQQFWDKTKTIKIDNNQTQATGQYYFPGYFRAKLLVDGEIIKEHDLFIQSDDWLGTIDYEPIPKYLTHSQIFNNGLQFSEKEAKEVRDSEKPITTTFHYVKDLGDISGDNFMLETKVKNTFTEKWGVCQKTTLIVVGTKSALLIPFSIPGCISEIGIMLSDNYLDGKKSDLSALGTDLSFFRDIQILNEEQKIKISLDGKEIYKNSYKESLGKVVGVRFKFTGVGEVKTMSLKDLKNNDFLSF